MNQLSLTDVTYKSKLKRNDEVTERLPVQVWHVNANVVSSKNKNGDGNGAVSTSSCIHSNVSISDPFCQVYIVTMDDAEEYNFRLTINTIDYGRIGTLFVRIWGNVLKQKIANFSWRRSCM